MGTLRVLFALAVVLAHSYGFVFIGGKNAVQLFYMISGFLISYVLVERKVYSNLIDFYINRYLRLYPIYFVVAILSLFAYTIAMLGGEGTQFFKVYLNAPAAAIILLIFSNATIFLQDWVMFLGVEHNDLVFSTSFLTSEVVLYPALLAPQAWTLGVELAFYLVAPFVLTRKFLLLSLLALSISLRVYLLHIGLGKSDPWTYRFFPTELALFLLGALAHQVLLPFYKETLFRGGAINTYSKLSTYFMIGIVLVYWIVPAREIVKTVVLFVVFLLLMPLVFVFQSNNKWDKWLGDLSYPIYICHMLVIFIVAMVLGRFGIADKLLTSAIVVAFTFGFAIVLNVYVGSPMESLRGRFRADSAATGLSHHDKKAT